MISQNPLRFLLFQVIQTISYSLKGLALTIIGTILIPVPWMLATVHVTMCVACWPPAYLAAKTYHGKKRENLHRYANWLIKCAWSWGFLFTVSVVIIIFASTDFNSKYVTYISLWVIVFVLGIFIFIRNCRMVRLYLSEEPNQPLELENESMGIRQGLNNSQGINEYNAEAGSYYTPAVNN